jgi:LuxR family transcriptional regulator, maltose regulon positive regulatory protein
MPEPDPILLQTKLNRPRLLTGLLQRTSLLDLLNKNIENPLILVCAPAGFGKTTLIGTWLEQMSASDHEKSSSLPSTWLSLDENDSDLTLFLKYFIAAIRVIIKDACEETLSLLSSPHKIPYEVLFSTFSNDLEKIPKEFILVLDDYHTIHSKEVHDLFNSLVLHWPHPLHLVLITRISPPLSLTYLRGKGLICEIRSRDLRFTRDETASYLQSTIPSLIHQDSLNLLDSRFEGWPAGLHLATLTFKGGVNQEAILETLSREDKNITGYLLDEVLSQQDPSVQKMLIMTSILDRFCVPLCEAVVLETHPEIDVHSCLDAIRNSELFLISLDDVFEWYRYHHLFQQFLQQKLVSEMGSNAVLQLHRQASIWLGEHGYVEEALQHALAAEDIGLAANHMSASLCDVLNHEDRPTLERWQRLLPEKVIQSRPELLMIRAWAYQNEWRLDLLMQTLQIVDQLLESEAGAKLSETERDTLNGQVFVLKSQWAYFTNDNVQAIEFSNKAFQLLSPEWKFARGGALYYLGMAMQANGQIADAERMLLDQYEASEDKDNAFSQLILQVLGFNYLKNGQLDRVRQIADLMLRQQKGSKLAVNTSLAAMFRGIANYEQNNLEDAFRDFTLIAENRYTAHYTAYRDAIAGLTLIHWLNGKPDEARKMVESISNYDMGLSGSEDRRTSSLRAHLMLLEGSLDTAGDWVDSQNAPPPNMALLWLEEPEITRVRILLARGRRDDLISAQEFINMLEEIIDRTHNTRHKVQILAMRAILSSSGGNLKEAESSLKKALDLARKGGFVRVFLDLGNPMRVLLEGMQKQQPSDDFLKKILGSFEPKGKYSTNIQSSNGDVETINKKPQKLIEPLTPRELEVLELLRGPMSMKEIARTLNISYGTVKRHTVNLYAKLGVNQRRNAVSRAEDLEILPPR